MVIAAAAEQVDRHTIGRLRATSSLTSTYVTEKQEARRKAMTLEL